MKLRKCVAVAVMALLVVFAPAARAQAEDDESAQLSRMLVDLDSGIAGVRALNEHLAQVPESDREAVMYRRDERTFDLLRQLDQIARGAAALPVDDPLRQEMTTRLEGEFAGVADLMFERTGELDQRIASFRTELEGLGGSQALAMEAYIYSLGNLRIRAYGATADLIESRSALGLPVEGVVERLRDELYFHAETVVGRLQYTGAAGKELRARLAEDPQNAEIDAAVKSFAGKHQQQKDWLQAITDALGRIGQDNTAYKAVLVQQGQTISVKDIERDLILDLISDSVASLRQFLADNGPDILFNLAIFFLILLVFRVLSRLTRRAVILACERSGADMSTLLKDVLASVSGGTVMVIGVLMALSQVGISLGPMLAGLGVAGFIVGFALQDTLGNFAAGGMILIYRPYDVDDFIEVAGASGLVKKMSLVSTTITTFDNQTLVVPNSRIWGDVIKNVTAQKLRRVDLEFGIGYGDDIEHAERVLQDVVFNHESVLKRPEPMIKVHTLGDSSVNFIVRPWVKTGDYWDVYWDLTRAVKLRFDQEGISIPFPQRDVHLYQEQA